MKTRLCLVLALVSGILAKDGAPYYGKFLGAFKTDSVEGDVYAVDARTLFIKGFSFDGQTSDAAFYGGSSAKAGPDGFVIPLERATAYSLSRVYDGEDITLTLPEGRTLKEVRWIAVWSQGSQEALSSVQIPVGFEYPRPQRLSALSGQHQVKSDRIYIVDAQTFLIPNFTYDGQAPDAFFWVGRGSKPNKDGIKIPNESGKLEPLRKYDSKTVVITLPAEMTVFDIGYLSVYCRAFEVNFGHIRIPEKLNVPPSLKMLGVAPQPDEEDDSSSFSSFHSVDKSGGYSGSNHVFPSRRFATVPLPIARSTN